MGTKKTNQEQVIEDVVNVLAPVIIAGALMLMVLPFYLTYVFFRSKARRGIALRESTGPRHFWLSAEEKIRFKEVFQAAMDAKKNKEDAIKLAEAEGILKNNDGQYSVRSNLGRMIRNTIDKSDQTLKDAAKILTYLKKKPHEEWAIVDDYFRKARAAKWGLIVFFVALISFLRMSTAASVWGESTDFLVWWGIATLPGVLAFYAAKALPRTSIHRHFDEPPEVSLSNIDSWVNSYSSTVRVSNDTEK